MSQTKLVFNIIMKHQNTDVSSTPVRVCHTLETVFFSNMCIRIQISQALQRLYVTPPLNTFHKNKYLEVHSLHHAKIQRN